MATTKPRITITLEPQRHELLRRLAEYQGVSMSHIVAELVESVSPVLERVCVAIENARKAQSGVRENLVRVAEESEKALMPHLEAAMGQLDIFLQQCDQAGAVEENEATGTGRDARKRARRGAGAEADEKAALGKNAKSSASGVKATSRAASKGKDPRPVITGVRVNDGAHSRRRKGHAV